MLKPADLELGNVVFLKWNGGYEFNPLGFYPFKSGYEAMWGRTTLTKVDTFYCAETGPHCEAWVSLWPLDQFMRFFDWERGGMEIWQTEGRWWVDIKQLIAIA